MLVDRELRERRDKRKRDKERTRLAHGDHFVSDDDSLGKSDDEESDFDSYDSSDDEYDEEYSPSISDNSIKKSRTVRSKLSEWEHKFNPLRFLAFSL